jgi:hypothetical protein
VRGGFFCAGVIFEVGFRSELGGGDKIIFYFYFTVYNAFREYWVPHFFANAILPQLPYI